MTKIDIISGFLGAGKTTLIQKLLKEAFSGEKLVIIENEFGEVSIDGGFLKDSGVAVTEMASGCICCSLVGDFVEALKEVKEKFSPDRIIIEPSGVGKLSDVVAAVEKTVAECPDICLNSRVAVADGKKAQVFVKNFGEFYLDQIESADTIVLSRTQKMSQEKLETTVAQLREKNARAVILTTPWDKLDGKTILNAIEKVSLADTVTEEAHEHHHHHHECHDPHCTCHGHHHEHKHEHEHEHHHDHECHDPNCTCHEHGHHHHHHADEVFSSWGAETVKTFSEEQLRGILAALDGGEYGTVLRAKGIVPAAEGGWLHFDYVPEEQDVRSGAADYTGRICVIGAQLKNEKLAQLFAL